MVIPLPLRRSRAMAAVMMVNPIVATTIQNHFGNGIVR